MVSVKKKNRKNEITWKDQYLIIEWHVYVADYYIINSRHILTSTLEDSSTVIIGIHEKISI